MKTPILFLHGWAKDMTGKKYHELASLLEKNGHKVYLPDLPGFGKNILKKESLVFEDYVLFVKDFIKKEIKTKKVILAGHSFGGRIAIRFTKEFPEFVEKLILLDASGIPRPLPSLKKRIVYVVTKILRPVFLLPPFSLVYQIFRKALYYAIGEMDYYKAGNLTQTFKNVYQISIVNDLSAISVPTLILWGRNDTFTPLADGEIMHNEIKNSKMVVVPEQGHRLPYENAPLVAKEIILFLS